MSELHPILLKAIGEACSDKQQSTQVTNRIKAWVEAAATGQLSGEEKLQRLGNIRDLLKVPGKK